MSQSLVTVAFLWDKGWFWFKFNKLRLALGMALKFDIRVVHKSIKTKSQKVSEIVLNSEVDIKGYSAC